MAVRTSSGANESTVKDFKYYTGVIPYNVVAVNPTLAELKKLGIEYLQKEPEYVLEQTFDNGTTKNSIVEFWCKSLPNPDYPDMELLTPVRFRINHEVWRGRNTGKIKYINKYGRVSGWVAEGSDLSNDKYWLDHEPRPMYRGEEELHKFLFAWLNMTYDTGKKEYDDCLLDVNKIIAGDFSELKTIVAGSPEYKVKNLTGVNVVEKEGKIRYYQQIYNQMFLKHNQTSTNRLEEYVHKDEYTEFKSGNGDLYFTFDIQEFNKSVKPDADPKEEAAPPADVMF